MMDTQEEQILAIDEEFRSGISEAEAMALKPIQRRFMESYLAHKDTMPVAQWLSAELAENLPDHSAEEIAQMRDDIIHTLHVQEEKKADLDKAVASGRSKESWFAGETKRAMSHMRAQESAAYLQELDHALEHANQSLYRTIQTQSGTINQNPCLDGFIAEQHHAQTFNLNAQASGSPYRAKVLEPNGKGYVKNSVDIVIVDESGNVARRYQSKYCKDAQATAKAFEHGDYRGQRKLVPEGQEQEVAKKVATVIEAPDGTRSTPLSKAQAKKLQNEAQSGNWNELNWNEYAAKDLAIGVGKQAGQAAIMGAAVGVGFDVAQKVWKGEEIKGEELIEAAVVSGADFGIKAAAAGALKVGAEKGIIHMIPKGTPAGTIANIAHVAVENVKVMGKMATGELTFKEGMEKMEQTTVATVAGIAASTKGAAIGATIGTVFGPVGTAVGGFIGGTIGYMAGSKIGETVTRGVQKIREKTRDVVRSIGETACHTFSAIASGIKSGLKSLRAW